MRNILQIINKDKVTLAYLNNLESGAVKQTVNGEYVLSFTALIESLKTEFLYDKNNLIEYNNDYFRVIKIQDEHNSDNMLKVYVDCEHISYDLIKQTKLNYTQSDKSAIYVMNDLLLSSGFQFLGTDVTTTASIEVKQETDIKSLLYMVTCIWGGELKYFQNTIELKQQLGQNRGTDFRFGKNLANLKRLINFVDNTVSYEVEVVQGTELEELGQYYIGDTIRVVDEALNVELDSRIIELETDIVTGLNSRVILGQPIKDLATGFTNIFNSIKNINNTLDEKTIELNNAITQVSNDVQAVEDGQIVTYYQNTQPTGKLGDLWFNSSTQKLYRYSTKWDLVEDKDITTAIQKAQSAQTTADGKIVSFYQDNMPTTAHEGDLWIDTNDNNKLYRYNGTDWVSARDGSISKIDNVIDEHGNLIASKLTGALNTAITKVSNSTGKTTFDDRGLIVHDQPIESTSTKAMLMTADGLLIANAKNADGTWRWRTAVTGDSIDAGVINTGTLTAINVNGVTITGSSITSDDANSEIKLNNGILSVKKKSSSQQFNINYRAGLPNGIQQSELEYYNEFKASNPNKPAENTISLNSANSHMGLEFGNGAVGLGNNWVKQNMYGGTTDWRSAWTTLYDEYYAQHQNDPVYNPPPTSAQGSKFIIDLVGNAWVYRNQTGSGGYIIPPLVLGNSFFRLNAHYVDIDCIDTKVSGNFKVTGTKNCTIDTEKYGELDFSAYETAEIYLGDIDENEVINGECVVNLDEKLLACVNTDLPYQVFITKYGKGDIWVEQHNKTNFVVKGDNIKFGWEVKAKRKGYESIRFGKVE